MDRTSGNKEYVGVYLAWYNNMLVDGTQRWSLRVVRSKNHVLC